MLTILSLQLKFRTASFNHELHGFSMKCSKLKQWYPVTCLKVHLSNMVDPPPERRVVMNSGIICCESCEGLPFPYPSLLPVLHSSLSPHDEHYSEHESFGITDVCRCAGNQREGGIPDNQTPTEIQSIFFTHSRELLRFFAINVTKV
jgi:hypothetical protein